ncbi:TetR/AcrR family transcriptional regulator [Actinomycetospora sp. NBRC 106378]|uniref:TetR/AcrR family transcriptional regulator n=1 Tax=Actinomycetospora sp. NBRC 106378 TaxID=3032208 RepID=UPI0024A129B7|nr:TetR/AcrR family transcriptional regulator [Actinomycetospora sp. NBRC 106378]GLZ53397.1 TetR family transcriptional regulator [Actinomycetospora sp. NBRC 106378]
MPRPRSDDKRAAIMAAATRIIAVQGLGAATAGIAKEAGVSNGSLFTYFDTKADLLNQLYLELKTEMGAAAGPGPAEADVREQLRHMWTGWVRWAAGQPEKRRALAQLGVSDEITAATHRSASAAMASAATVLDRSREHGPMRDEPLAFVLALATALADATIDSAIIDPANAEARSRAGFDALWRTLS